jgi:hypothetical protein
MAVTILGDLLAMVKNNKPMQFGYEDLPKRVKVALGKAFPTGPQKHIDHVFFDATLNRAKVVFRRDRVSELNKTQMRALCRADAILEFGDGEYDSWDEKLLTFSFPCFTANGRRYDV